MNAVRYSFLPNKNIFQFVAKNVLILCQAIGSRWFGGARLLLAAFLQACPACLRLPCLALYLSKCGSDLPITFLCQDLGFGDIEKV